VALVADVSEYVEKQVELLNRLYRSGVRRGMYEAAQMLADGKGFQDVIDAAHGEWGEDGGSTESES
jgi:hypothetical protein